MCSVKPSENHRYQIREKLNYKKSVFRHFSCRAYPPLVSIGSPLDSGQNRKLNTSHSLRKKCPYSELFWSAFSRIRTEYREILRISPYSVRMRENTDQNNFEYGHFLRSDFFQLLLFLSHTFASNIKTPFLENMVWKAVKYVQS